MVTSVLVPSTSLGKRMSKRTAEPMESSLEASRNTPAALTFEVVVSCLPAAGDWMVIGSCSGKRLPVRDSRNLGLLLSSPGKEGMFIPRKMGRERGARAKINAKGTSVGRSLPEEDQGGSVGEDTRGGVSESQAEQGGGAAGREHVRADVLL